MNKKQGNESTLKLSGERFTAIYHIKGNPNEARTTAEDICIEQTIEYPEDLVTRQDIRQQIFGKISSLKEIKSGLHEVKIDFAVEIAGEELTQLLNVLFGNISLKPKIRLVGIQLAECFRKFFKGPRFGREGFRRLLKAPPRPLLCTALKPMGLSPKNLADLAYSFAQGGIDMIKDDHGLTDQVFCPFKERISRCADAVMRSNRETGRSCIYIPNVTAPIDQVFIRARLARDAGAGGIMVAPGLVGHDTMRKLAADDDLGLPIISHPALQGSLTVNPGSGIAHGVIFGLLNRLAGADACIFPSYGGRFHFTREECRDVKEGCENEMNHLKPIFPVPAGGMSLGQVPEIIEFYGPEVILLIGGDLHRRGPNLTQNCHHFVQLAASTAHNT